MGAHADPPGSPSQPLAPWLQRQLAEMLRQRGHALLLAGPSGLGQYELALALAQAWLCDQPTASGACGVCPSCHGVAVRTHPELLVLMPEVLALAHDWPLDEKTRDRIEKKEIKPSKWIRVEAARGVVGFSQTTRSRGRVKVVLVFPADRLNTEAANTLLKTLEEPPGDLRFVLGTEAAHMLPATVRSRCQTVALTWPTETEVLPWLLEQSPGTRPDQARIWLQAAGGRPSDALEWAELGLQPDQWHSLPKALARGEATAMTAWDPARWLDVLQKLAHDLMAVAAGGNPRYFARSDLPPLPRWPALQAWVRDLMLSARSVEHPYQAALLQDAWMARIQQVWQPTPGSIR